VVNAFRATVESQCGTALSKKRLGVDQIVEQLGPADSHELAAAAGLVADTRMQRGNTPKAAKFGNLLDGSLPRLGGYATERHHYFEPNEQIRERFQSAQPGRFVGRRIAAARVPGQGVTSPQGIAASESSLQTVTADGSSLRIDSMPLPLDAALGPGSWSSMSMRASTTPPQPGST